jgi:hypothetical protein
MKRALPILGLLTACLAGSADLLPEMKQHLDFGHRCVRLGYDSGAQASCELILLPQILVYVDERGSTPEARAAIGEAAFIWEDALEHETMFVRVHNRKEAQVVITFRDRLQVDGNEAGGFTEWSRSVKWANTHYEGKLQATIVLRTHQPNGKPMTRFQARHAMLHEFGHLLGLDDSPQKGGVMAPLNLRKPIGTPSEQEVRTIRSLRDEAMALKLSAVIDRWR